MISVLSGERGIPTRAGTKRGPIDNPHPINIYCSIANLQLKTGRDVPSSPFTDFFRLVLSRMTLTQACWTPPSRGTHPEHGLAFLKQ